MTEVFEVFVEIDDYDWIAIICSCGDKIATTQPSVKGITVSLPFSMEHPGGFVLGDALAAIAAHELKHRAEILRETNS